MGVLANICNTVFVLAPPAPPLAHCKNVDASEDNGSSRIVVLMFERDE